MNSKHSLSLAIAVAGAVLMAAIVSGVVLASPHPYIGSHLYDLYAQALLHGHFDLPAMELRYEGHFTPDGKGYLYHGLGPVLTRLPFAPFVEFPTRWIAPLSIWFWAVIGNAAFHRAFALALARGMGGASNVGTRASALLAVAVWFASPGLLLVGNGAVFFEPISMAYALGGVFVLLIVQTAWGAMTIERAIAPLALVAGLALHARPHLAVGYYATVCLFALSLVWRGGRRQWQAASVAMLVLGLFGAALLGSNAARFGHATAVHGSFTKSDVQYASTYWGLEQETSRRARAFSEHGQFNARRILPNAIVYFASPPSGLGMDKAIEALEHLHDRLIAPSDFVTINQPKVGALFLWPGWILLMLVGLSRKALWRMPALAGLPGVATGFLLMLSYPTITLRYHIDLWPMIALPAVLGLEAVARRIGQSHESRLRCRPVLPILLAVGLLVTFHKTAHSRVMNVDSIGKWTTDFCLELTARKGFGISKSRKICGFAGRANAVR